MRPAASGQPALLHGMSGPLRRDGSDWLLDVRVQPRASRTEFAGFFGDRLKVRLQAPPVDGRANEALLEFVADACGLPRSRVSLDAGQTSRDKRVRLHGLGPLPAALQSAISPSSEGTCNDKSRRR